MGDGTSNCTDLCNFVDTVCRYIMAKKPASQPQAAKPAPTTPAKSPAAVARPTPTASTSAPSAKVTAKELSPRSSPQEIAVHVWNRYIQDTPSRTLFLDVFLLYIALLGAITPSTPSSLVLAQQSANSSLRSLCACRHLSDHPQGPVLRRRRRLREPSMGSRESWWKKRARVRSAAREHLPTSFSAVSSCMDFVSTLSTEGRTATKGKRHL